MNKRFLVLVVTGCAFATILAAGCAARKRAPMSMAPVMISSAAAVKTTTTAPSVTEAKIQKITAVHEETTETIRVELEEPDETVETTAKPTKKPTRKPTKKPTKKPTAKPTKKPTKKPTAKPAAKVASKKSTDSVKTGNLAAAPKTGLNSQNDSNKISGIYNGAWSQITVDAGNLNNVKLTVTIHDQDDPNKTSVWKMSGKFNSSNGNLTYTNCIKTNYIYDESGNVVSKKTAYDKGHGKAVIKNGMITWNDYQEHAADDMTFISADHHDHRG